MYCSSDFLTFIVSIVTQYWFKVVVKYFLINFLETYYVSQVTGQLFQQKKFSVGYVHGVIWTLCEQNSSPGDGVSIQISQNIVSQNPKCRGVFCAGWMETMAALERAIFGTCEIIEIIYSVDFLCIAALACTTKMRSPSLIGSADINS